MDPEETKEEPKSEFSSFISLSEELREDLQNIGAWARPNYTGSDTGYGIPKIFGPPPDGQMPTGPTGLGSIESKKPPLRDQAERALSACLGPNAKIGVNLTGEGPAGIGFKVGGKTEQHCSQK